MKQRLEKVIAELNDIVSSITDSPIIPPIEKPTEENKTLTVSELGIINGLKIEDNIDRVIFTQAQEVIGLKAKEGKILNIVNKGSNPLNISVSVLADPKDKFTSAKWMPQNDEVTYQLTSQGWVRYDLSQKPIPEQPSDKGDVTYPQPEPIIETPTNTIQYGVDGRIDMMDKYGTDFKKLINDVGDSLQEVYLKGEFELSEDLIFPENLKLVFNYDASITFKNCAAKIYSRIQADYNSHIFKIEGERHPKLYPSSCDKVSVKWFGVNETNQDNQPFFQLAIKCSDYVGAFHVPHTEFSKPYKIKKTIDFLSDGNWQDGFINFPKWIITGDGISDGASMYQSSSCIEYIGTEHSAINIRGARWLTKLQDFEVRGVNLKPIDNANQGFNFPERSKPSDWISQGLSVDQNTHYAGITIDGIPEGEATRASAQIEMSGIKISGFVVGLSISPALSNQADTIDLNKCKFSHNAYHVSIGQDQARAITFTNCWMNESHTIFTNRKFGKRNGSMFNIIGGQYTTSYKIFDVAGQFAGNSFIQGAYFEACGVIGSLTSTGVNSNAIFFQGCDFKLDDNGYLGGGTFITPYLMIDGGSNVTFDSCSFRSLKKYIGLSSGVNGRFTFRGCGFADINQIQIDGASGSSNQNRLNIEGCTWHNMSIDLNDNPIIRKDRKRVRLNLKQFTKVEGDGSPNTNGITIIPTGTYILPDFWGFNPIDQQEKDFVYQTNDWSRFVEGDYVTASVRGNIDGMDLSVGTYDVPCLEVLKVEQGQITLRKLAPEVDLSLTTVNWGRPWIFNECFIDGADEILLKSGDWFNDEKGSNRKLKDGSYIRPIIGKVKGR